ncbi:uncharacterized protein ttc6 [Mustelus asterias]
MTLLHKYVLFSKTTKDHFAKDQGYQTIHHLCTTEPSHVLPIDLQLASKLYHTPSRKGRGSSKLPESIQQEGYEICSDKDFSSSKQQKIARIGFQPISPNRLNSPICWHNMKLAGIITGLHKWKTDVMTIGAPGRMHQASQADWYRDIAAIAGFFCIQRATDCNYVASKVPGSQLGALVNRKGYHNLNVQIMCQLRTQILQSMVHSHEELAEEESAQAESEANDMQIHKDATKLLWTPAFPKFAVPISHMKETLFPKLQVGTDQVDEYDFAMKTFHLDREYDMDEEQERLEEKAAMFRTLFKKHNSFPDLRVLSFYSSDESFRNNNFQIKTPETTVYHPEEKRKIIVFISLNNTIDKPSTVKHSSLPNLSLFDDESGLTITAPFQTLMKEVELQRQQLIQATLQTTVESEHLKKESQNSIITEAPQLLKSPSLIKLVDEKQRATSVSESEQVVKGTKKTKHQKKVKAYMRKSLLPRKLAFAYRKLLMPAKVLKRSESLSTIVRLPVIGGKEPRPKILQRNLSLPSLFNFESYAKKQGGIPKGADVREWVRDIWNVWFDEIYPPPEPSSETTVPKKDSPLALKGKKSSNLHPNLIKVELQNIQDSDEKKTAVYPAAEESEAIRAALQSALSELTYQIAVNGEATAFNYCRRGAVNRRLGQLKSAMEDLNEAIRLEPLLIDAYWQRHFIYLLQLNTSDALDDLNFVLKHNKNHADAYTSKGDIYRNRGDITLAIINYSQGLKCRPDDDVHFKRAEMYEKNNDLLMAMEDYLMAFTLNPKRTDAMMKRGLYYFENSNWHLAIQDLTTLIKWDPINAKARNYRGQAYAKQAMYKEAIEDLSAAVHLDPNNWVAFYHRGCLLRKVYPQKALQDFSVSVLINNEVENLESFLHRGILYTELNEWHAAIYDFENVIKLDRSVSFAHINLGLIFLLKMDYYYEAIRRFTNAIKVEPTSTRAYVCRAQANHKIHNLKSALKDITCAIHLQPQTHYFYLLRGQYLFEMRNFELASFCIQYSAEVNQASDSSPIQQAKVQLFLKNYDKAISTLAAMEKTTTMFSLLGKSQMKASKFEDALISFQKALDLEPEVPEVKVANKLKERAEMYYNMGLCYTELSKLRKAIDSFNNTLKFNPKFAKAYYQRGLCRMKLHDVNCVQDFHRALEINPQLFEAYHLAVEDLTSAINIDDTCILSYFNRAVCYQQANDLQKALKDYGIVLLLGSQKKLNLKVLVNRGLLYLSIGDYYNALKMDPGLPILNPSLNAHRQCNSDSYTQALLMMATPTDFSTVDHKSAAFLRKQETQNDQNSENNNADAAIKPSIWSLLDAVPAMFPPHWLHSACIQDFKAAIVEEPENANIHHAVAICCHKLHYLEEAANSFSQALKLDPFFADAYNGRGNVYMDSVHEAGIKQAQKDFVRALHLNPKAMNSRINLGFNFQVLGRFQRAWNQFTIAIDIDPTLQAAYEGRAVVNLQVNNIFGAFQDINAALKISASAKLFTNRGVISQFTGDRPNAMRDYQKAITLDPTYSLAYFNAANLYFHNRQFSLAHEYYTKAIDLQPDDESALLNRAICRVLLRHAKEAFEDFAEAIKLSPYSAHIYFNRANLYATLKQYKEAEKDYSQALQLMPDDALFYKLRADVRGHLGMTEEAIVDYKKAIVIQEAGRFIISIFRKEKKT